MGCQTGTGTEIYTICDATGKYRVKNRSQLGLRMRVCCVIFLLRVCVLCWWCRLCVACGVLCCFCGLAVCVFVCTGWARPNCTCKCAHLLYTCVHTTSRLGKAQLRVVCCVCCVVFVGWRCVCVCVRVCVVFVVCMLAVPVCVVW